jgi:hypothetical protein
VADCFIIRLPPQLYSELEEWAHLYGKGRKRLVDTILNAEVGQRPDGDTRAKRRDWCACELKYIRAEVELLHGEMNDWVNKLSGGFSQTDQAHKVKIDAKALALALKALKQSIEALENCEFPGWNSEPKK